MQMLATTNVQLVQRCRCVAGSDQSCWSCDGTAAEYVADLLGLDQLGEPCHGLDDAGWPCAARGEYAGWCAEHSVLSADRLPVEVPAVAA